MNCFEEQIDRRLPFGNEYSRLLGTTDPDAMQSLPVTQLQVGAIIELLHVNTGVKMAFSLESGAMPAEPNPFVVLPVDGAASNKYWRLQSLWKGSTPLTQNVDANHFNLLTTKGAGTPQLSLSNDPSRKVDFADFD
jgi:hypothetical protein